MVARKADAKDSLAVVPWYWRDWRASTARAVLLNDPAAALAYRELLDAMWCDGSLPDDDATLCALCGLDRPTWERVRESVLRWLPEKRGRRTNTRLSHEREKALAYREGCRTGGRKTAEKRWGSGSRASSPPTTEQVGREAVGYRTPSPTPYPDPDPSPDPDQIPPSGGGGGGGVRSPEPEPERGPRRWSPAEQAARLLAAKIGSSIDVCRKQVRALVEDGWSLERVTGAIHVHARPGLTPWAWTKAAHSSASGLSLADAFDAIPDEAEPPRARRSLP